MDPHTCALVYSFAHHHAAYDEFNHPIKPWESKRTKPFDGEYVYWELTERFNLEFHEFIYFSLKVIGHLALVLCAYLYWNGIRLNKGFLLASCFVANIVLSLPSYLVIHPRYGVDTSAYINQAAQVVHGQRDYTLLDTNQGPCFYPAGHLWLYYPVYLLYTHTEKAEYIFKFVHFIVHSLTNLLVCLVGFEYFKDEPWKAQFLPFLYVANTLARREESLLYNDQFMAFFCVLGLYFIVCKN